LDAPCSAARARAATWTHWATLVVGAAVLLWISRDMWFLLDEWAFIVDRHVLPGEGAKGLLDPHNEHWSTIATLTYRGLFELFGVRSYWPYLALAVAAHVAVAHLLWRLVRRVSPEPWLATGAATAFLFLGVGWENMTRAFQVTLMGSLAMGLLWLLAMPTSSRFERRDVLGWGLGVLGLMFSGVGVAMVAMAALYALLRRGWRMALVVVSVPAVVYLAWMAAFARRSFSDGGQPLEQGVRDLPAYVWAGLTGAVDLTTGLAGVGVVVVVGLAVLAVRRGALVDARWATALAAAGGAVAMLGFTALRRSQYGIETADDSRYVYLVVALLVPLACLAVDELAGGRRRLVPLVAVGTAGLLVVQLPVLWDQSKVWTALVAEGRGVLIASVELVRDGEPILSTTPYPWYAPDVQVDELVQLADGGDLLLEPRPTEAEVLTARTFTQIRVGFIDAEEAVVAPTPPDLRPRLVASSAVTWTQAGEGCLRFVPTGDGPLVQLSPGGPVELTLVPGLDGMVAAMYVAPDGTASALRANEFPVFQGHGLALESAAEGPDLRLGLPAGGATVCGLVPPDA
jgi:hypothetical protein